MKRWQAFVIGSATGLLLAAFVYVILWNALLNLMFLFFGVLDGGVR